MTPTPTKIVSVIGATGTQGGSVVNTLLKNSSYTVRAITRNPHSASAQSLKERGVEVVQADANDISSLIRAFEGSYAIYAITDFFEPFTSSGPEKAIEIEAGQGINLAKAAQATPTLQHYIWSTLPPARTISEGKFLIPHFESKNRVDEYIRSQPELVAKTTFFWITFYASNYGYPIFTPYHIPTAGKYVQFQSTPADTPVLSVGSVEANIGPIAEAILTQTDKTLAPNGRVVLASVEETTMGGLLEKWARAQGKTAQYVQVDRNTFNAMWPGWSEEMGVMMEFWDWAREKSWAAPSGGVITINDLGVTGLVGAESTFAREIQV